jgi:hypothetical protein
MSQDGTDLSTLSAAEQVTFGPDALAEALSPASVSAWLGPLDSADGASWRRHAADLRLRVSDRGSALFRKAAYVEFGTLVHEGDELSVPISWRAAGLAPLFPIFAGRLSLRAGQLEIKGWYAPPGGVIGRAADRLLLRLAAERTGRWLLGELIAATQAEALASTRPAATTDSRAETTRPA